MYNNNYRTYFNLKSKNPKIHNHILYYFHVLSLDFDTTYHYDTYILFCNHNSLLKLL